MRLRICLLIFSLFAVTGCITPSSNLNETLINSCALLEKDYLKFLASAAISSPGGSIVLNNPTINQIPDNSASSLLGPGSFGFRSLPFIGYSNPSDIYIGERENVPGCDIRAGDKICKYDPPHVFYVATVKSNAQKYSCVTTIYDNVFIMQLGTRCQLVRR